MPNDQVLEMIGQSLSRQMKQASESEACINGAGETWKNMIHERRVGLLTWYGHVHPQVADKEASREFDDFSQTEKGAIAALLSLKTSCDYA